MTPFKQRATEFCTCNLKQIILSVRPIPSLSSVVGCRFLLLRRRSTRLRLMCAVVVALCEFVCLIPSIFPQLEPDKDHNAEGGSTGAWKFLWPMFMVLSQVRQIVCLEYIWFALCYPCSKDSRPTVSPPSLVGCLLCGPYARNKYKPISTRRCTATTSQCKSTVVSVSIPGAFCCC